jgi:hypothetical protein
MKKHNERIVCKDGFEMSVQANETAYCDPRIDDAGRYKEVEVGYPNELEPMLMPWAENEENPLGTVYGYVPAERISLICAKHGGIVSGELPAGIPYIHAIEE